MTSISSLLSRPINRPLHPFAVAIQERGLTIDEAADALEVSERSVRHWLSWTRRPRRELRERWAEELGQDYFPTLASYARRHPERRRIKLGSVPTDDRGVVSTVLVGDALEILRSLPDDSAQACVTSPPYFGLRKYTDLNGEIGRERTVDAYVRKLVAVFSEVKRVLRRDGTLWLNVGDSYSGRQQDERVTSKKGLLGVPWRLAHALQSDGWIVRSEIVWAKTNPAPESVRDRPTRSHELVFLLSKRGRYFYDASAMREPRAFIPDRDRDVGRYEAAMAGFRLRCRSTEGLDEREKERERERIERGPKASRGPLGILPDKNRRSVWTISTSAGKANGGHVAPYPIELPSRCVRASTKPGDVVIDPFCGSGTTGVAALRLRRSFLGVDIDPRSAGIAGQRLMAEMRDD